MPKFEKGNNYGKGRPKGSQNHSTSIGKAIIENYFIRDNGLESLLADIEAMENERDKVNAKIKLIEYFMPKQKEIDLKANVTGDILSIELKPTGVKLPTKESEIKE